ncbi:hypothetical protein AB205_0134850 [Aquarana catesbeiana]|uniref:Uncharacterized protein n=1 Tax=Aquarana catesbeiana TaxID=8400 RepID=A0A2G9QIN4_AQUCT|nr:hypothetical protein AB205_0134850 [Aquarana catesbeiana]
MAKNGKYCSLFKREFESCLKIGFFHKQTIVHHFKARFHIPISGLKYQCAKYTFSFILIGEKRLRQQSEDTRTPQTHLPELVINPSPSPRPCPPEDLEEGEVEEVAEICTPSSDVLIVAGQAVDPFSTDSAQRLIGQIMVWNGHIDVMRNQIDNMRNRLDSMQQEMKNMIDVLGRIKSVFP